MQNLNVFVRWACMVFGVIGVAICTHFYINGPDKKISVEKKVRND